MILRDYQATALAEVATQYQQGHRSVVLQMPTGSGKTPTVAHAIHRAVAKGRRVLVLVHRAELLDQASRTLLAMGIDHGIVVAGRAGDEHQAVQLASVQTIARRLHQYSPEAFGLIVIDECHHAVAGQWSAVLDHFPSAYRLGVTATPCRLDGRGLGEMFTALVQGPTVRWLVEQDHLSRSRVFAPPVGFSADGLHTRMGDYNLSEASDSLAAVRVMGDVIGHYRTHLGNGTAIAFCCTVKHAEDVAAAFNEAGIVAASIDGKMSTDHRRSLLERLGAGEIKVLTSCALIGEGVDVPSVGGCIMLRPTKSEALYLQMVGRCLRPSPGKQYAVILDHVGNVEQHGHHEEDREWSLEGLRKRAKGNAPAVKVCGCCYAANTGGTRECIECGEPFPVAPVREVVQLKGELREIMAAGVRERKREQGKAQTLADLVKVGQARGMKNPAGWARHVLAGRQSKVTA